MARNVGESVNAKLRDIARRTGTDMVSLQTRYAIERLLFRLSISAWKDKIALKGALIFLVHENDVHRPTGDVDLNGFSKNGSVSMTLDMVRDACAIDVEDDGIRFDVDSIEVRKERDWSQTPGGKVEMNARIHTSVVRVRIDMGYGNAIVPEAKWCEYPTILPSQAAPRILVCPYETMIAEKLHAMVKHGAETTRLRDYYDIWSLTTSKTFSLPLLVEAFRRTFEVCKDPLPTWPLDGLSEDFLSMASKPWDKFRNAKGLKRQAPPLQETLEIIKPFIRLIVQGANGLEPIDGMEWKGASSQNISSPSP
jgi:predicted nucleotidyltransferase component of viral defense system